MEILKNFSQIEIETPVDKIIRQIRDLISSGQLNPGDRLPAERQLSERLGVGRTHLRDAIRKLEFYGILKTLPQSGTFVAGIGIPALEGLITDMLSLRGNDIKSLVETRVILEKSITRLAAENRTQRDIDELEAAFMAHRDKIFSHEDAVEEDLLFHLRIADASKNSVLNSLMLLITPDIMQYFKKHNVCGQGRAEVATDQHEVILEHIKNQDPDKAEASIMDHLSGVSEYVESLKMQLNGNGNGNGIY